MKRDDVAVVRQAPFEQRLRALDLAQPRQEGERAAALFAQDRRGGVGYRLLGLRARRVLPVADVDGEGTAAALDHGRLAQQARHAGAVQRRRHDEDAQIGPERRLDVERQRQAEIGIEGAFVEFVEEDGGDAGEFRVVQDHAGEKTFGHDEDAGVPAEAALHAHGVADGPADLLADHRCHAPRGGARGQSPWLEDQDAPALRPFLLGEDEGNQRRLAGAGRRYEHRVRAVGQRGAQLGQCLGDGEIGEFGQAHPAQLPS